jgi:hypothetical protein
VEHQNIVLFRHLCLYARLSTGVHAPIEPAYCEGWLSVGNGLSPLLTLPPCVTGLASGDPFVSVVSSGTLLTFNFPFEKMASHRFENSSADTEKGLGELPLPLILVIS